jgi:hypothetical protein
MIFLSVLLQEQPAVVLLLEGDFDLLVASYEEIRWTRGFTWFKGHVAAPELPGAGQRELEPQDTWRPQSCPGLGSGSWSRRTRGGPRAAPGWAVGAGAAGHVAALGWAAGAGATGHVAAPELPRAGQRELELQDTWWPQSCHELCSSC